MLITRRKSCSTPSNLPWWRAEVTRSSAWPLATNSSRTQDHVSETTTLLSLAASAATQELRGRGEFGMVHAEGGFRGIHCMTKQQPHRLVLALEVVQSNSSVSPIRLVLVEVCLRDAPQLTQEQASAIPCLCRSPPSLVSVSETFLSSMSPVASVGISKQRKRGSTSANLP